MSFFHRSGPAHTESYQKTASVAIAANTPVALAGGYIRQSAVASTRLVGINIKKVASTDDDYASNTSIPVLIPTDEDVFEADVSGTATIANVGQRYDLTTLSDGTDQDVNLSGTTYGVVTVVGFISSSKVLVKFNGALQYADINT